MSLIKLNLLKTPAFQAGEVYILAAVLAVLLQLFFRTFFWPAVVVAVASQRWEDSKKVYVLAFFSGVASDLVVGRPVGESAVFLLVVAAVLIFLNLRFKQDLRIAAVAVVFAQLLYRVLVINLGF